MCIELNVAIGAPVRQLSTSASGENLVFTLAAHIARPDWSFGSLERTRQGMEHAEIVLR